MISTKYGSSKLTYQNNTLINGSEVYRPIKPSSGDWAQINKVREELKYQGNYDFEYSIGFDNKFPLSISVYNTKTKTYLHQIFFGFGFPNNAQNRGMAEFGVAVTTPDGTVENKVGKQEDAYVTIHNLGSIKNIRFFTGTVLGQTSQWWNSKVYITSSKKTIILEYAPVFYTGRNEVISSEFDNFFSVDSQRYIYGKRFSSESYTPTYVIDQDGNVISRGNK